MKISKPLNMAISHTTFSFENRFIFSMTGVISFNLINGEVTLEQEMWNALAEVLESGSFDSGVKKKSPEYLVNGCFFSPNAVPVEGGEIKANVGNLSKKLWLFGERYWTPTGLSSTASLITQMPILYKNAFGGDNFSFNTQGKGIAIDDDGVQWLPNVETPAQVMTHASATPAPAGLAQLSVQNSPRKDMIGSVKDSDDPFSYPKNINWHYFNDAPKDQWFDKPLNGNEHYRFENMHPEHAVIEGQIPAFKAKASIKRHIESNVDKRDQFTTAATRFEEIELVLDTLWFCPHKEMGALIFHGSTETGDRYGSDIAHLLLAFEDTLAGQGTEDSFSGAEGKGAPTRDKAWYQTAMLNREDDDKAIKYMLYCKDIIPDSVELDLTDIDDDDPDAMQDFMGENIDLFMDNTESELKQDMRKQLGEAQTHLDKTLKKTHDDLTGMVAPLVIQLADLNYKKASASDIKIIEQQKNVLDEKVQHISDEMEKHKNFASEMIEKFDDPKIDDPELQKLMDFIESIAPKLPNKPDVVDIAAVDMKKMEQLGDKIDAYMDSKMAEIEPDIIAQFKDAKAQLQAVDITGSKATDNPQVLAAQQQVNEKLAKSLPVIEKMELETLAMLRGKPLPTPLFRPPTGAEFDGLEQSLAETKIKLSQQMSELKPQLISIKKDIEQQMSLVAVGSSEFNEWDVKLADIDKQLTANYDDSLNEMEQQLAEQKQQLNDSQGDFKESYAIGAHTMEQGLSPHEQSVDVVASLLLTQLANKTKVAGGDYACITLNNETLTEVDLSHCYLEQTIFTDCKFNQVNFDSSIAARIEFNHCQFIGCTFDNANLGASKISDCSFESCSFKATIISNSQWNACTFVKCIIDNAQSLELTLNKISFKECELLDLNFLEMSFPHIQFIECRLKGCNFIELEAVGLICTDCVIESNAWVGAKLTGADFSGTQFNMVVFAGDTDLANTQFVNITGECVNLSNINLQQANFTGASLTMAYLADATLTDACFNQANLPQANFMGANLRKASFNGANLMEANFTLANLVSASLKNSNLFNSNFMDVTLGDTNFSGAELKNTLLEDWRP